MKQLTGAERKEALELVEEIQETRATRFLLPSEVPKVLLPYQAKWHADLSPVRLGEKPRRIGFTWGSMAAESSLEAALQVRAGGMDQFYMGYNMRMAAEFIGDCAFFAKAYSLASSAIDVGLETVVINNEKQDVVMYKIRMASGFVVEALSSAPHNWRGRQGHARIDEAAFHQNLAEVVKGALAFLMWGGRVDIVSTHNSEENPFNGFIKQILAGTLPWSLHRINFAQALEQGFFQRVCLVKGWKYSKEAEEEYRAKTYADYPNPEDAGEELDCIPKRGSGVYFPRMLVESASEQGVPIVRHTKPAEFVLDPQRLQTTENWFIDHVKPLIDAMPSDKRTAYGQDFARDGDLSAIWILQEVSRYKWRTPFLLELRRIPFDCQKLITLALLDMLPLFHRAAFDARGNGQSHAEAALQAKGPDYVDCVQLSLKWYGFWFPKYKQAYEDKAIIAPYSEDVIADHRLVELRNGIPGMPDKKTKGSDGEYRHGDTAIAGVLAYSAAMTDGGVSPDFYTVRDMAASGLILPGTDTFQRALADDAAFRSIIQRGSL